MDNNKNKKKKNNNNKTEPGNNRLFCICTAQSNKTKEGHEKANLLTPYLVLHAVIPRLQFNRYIPPLLSLYLSSNK